MFRSYLECGMETLFFNHCIVAAGFDPYDSQRMSTLRPAINGARLDTIRTETGNTIDNFQYI